MGKFIFFAVFFTALVAVSVAQGEQSFRDMQCRGEVQEKPLHACREILHQQMTGGGHKGEFSVPRFQTEWDTRERCCRQLQSVHRECRCSALRGMVRDYEQTMPLLGQEHGGWPGEQQEQGYCGGETAEHHQQRGAYYVEEGRGRQGQVLRDERLPLQQQEQQHGEGFYGETSRGQQGQKSYHEGAQQKQIVRVKLLKARQYAARLPTVCQIEPMECSVFSDDQYY